MCFSLFSFSSSSWMRLVIFFFFLSGMWETLNNRDYNLLCLWALSSSILRHTCECVFVCVIYNLNSNVFCWWNVIFCTRLNSIFHQKFFLFNKQKNITNNVFKYKYDYFNLASEWITQILKERNRKHRQSLNALTKSSNQTSWILHKAAALTCLFFYTFFKLQHDSLVFYS